VYDSVVKEVETYTQKKAKTFLANVSEESFLSDLCVVWKDHKSSMKVICDLMMYLDNIYVVAKDLKPLFQKSLEIFRDVVVRHEDARDRLRHVLLDHIRRDRKNEVIDRISLKTVLGMLHEIGKETYRTEFEIPFLKFTKDFYIAETNTILRENTCTVYLVKATKRLREEDDRVAQYLNICTLKPLQNVMMDVLIRSRAKTLVEMKDSGCVYMFKNRKLENLSRMYVISSRHHSLTHSLTNTHTHTITRYDLFCKVPETLRILRECMKNELLKLGHSIVRDPKYGKNPIHFITKVLSIREQYGEIIENSFRGDKNFHRALKEAFEKFLNVNKTPARYLSMYVDLFMKGKIAADRHERSSRRHCHLDRVILIFRYLHNRDVFAYFYKTTLAERLLSSRSSSDSDERGMITRLKTECGYQYASKMEGMWKDIKNISQEVNQRFEKWLRRNRSDDDGVKINIRVLTTGFWPTNNIESDHTILPDSVVSCCKHFEKFYHTHFTGRRLVWNKRMGQAVLYYQMSNKKQKELLVTAYQMCVLMLFNDEGTVKLTTSQIESKTKIPRAELNRHLASLCTEKCQLLRSRKMSPTERSYSLNSKFQNQKYRIKVPLLKRKLGSSSSSLESSGSEKSSGIPRGVIQERQCLLDANIVRVMKSRLTMAHNALVAEITRQVQSRFRPTPQDIKKRIENLISREYLKRSKDDDRIYNYIS